MSVENIFFKFGIGGEDKKNSSSSILKDWNFYKEKYYSRCISVPMYPSLSDKEQSYVINKINHFYGLNK